MVHAAARQKHQRQDRLFLDPVIKIHPQCEEVRNQYDHTDRTPYFPRNSRKVPVNQFYSKNHGSKRLKKKFNKKFRILSESRKERHIHRARILIHRLGIAPEIDEERDDCCRDQGDRAGRSDPGKFRRYYSDDSVIFFPTCLISCFRSVLLI